MIRRRLARLYGLPRVRKSALEWGFSGLCSLIQELPALSTSQIRHKQDSVYGNLHESNNQVGFECKITDAT
jgi:hypothetical protein